MCRCEKVAFSPLLVITPTKEKRRKILNYRYSSAGFYATGHDEFGLMTILAEWRGAYCPVRNTGFVGDNTNKGEKDGYGGHA